MSKTPEKDNSINTEPPSVCMVCAFPPPVHGMAAVNAEVRKQLMESNIELYTINVASQNLQRSVFSRLSRISTVMSGLIRFMSTWKLQGSTLYISPSGGYGQVYELFFLSLARFRGMKIYLHHHSFAYLDKYFWVADLLTKIAGQQAVHITLSQGMAEKLQKQYAVVKNVIPISNATFFTDNKSVTNMKRDSVKTIGFISNIAKEKGVFDFLELLEACEQKGLPIKGKVAGPFQDEETEKEFNQRISKLSTVDYVGPQYGDQKENYFNSIDVLIFPTRYANEAEPLTIHEAMKYGIPVIAFGRGSIPELVDSKCGQVIQLDSPFVPAALEKLIFWKQNPDEYKMASNSAAERFAKALTMNKKRWQELLTEMVAGVPPKG